MVPIFLVIESIECILLSLPAYFAFNGIVPLAVAPVALVLVAAVVQPAVVVVKERRRVLE